MCDNSLLKKRFLYVIGISAIGIFVLTFMVYTPALKNDFVNWDDDQYVYENANIKSLNLKSSYWMLTSSHASNWHPLTWLSHTIDHAFWKLNPLGHHLTNNILHGLNTLLVFLLVMRLMYRSEEFGGIPLASKTPLSISTKSLIVASTTALLFGLHPLHVESVAWVAERKDLLCASFVLLSIISYLSYTSSILKSHRRILFATCLLLFIFALMSKPMAVTLPVILLLLDIYPLKRVSLYPGITSKNLLVLLEKIPFFALSIASGIVTIMVQKAGGAVKTLEWFPIDSRLLNALGSLVFYLERMIVPSKLVPFYPFPVHAHWLDLQYLLSAFLVLAITGFCLWMVKKGNDLFLIAWLYYVITVLPVLGIIQVGNQAAADRYTYLPSLSIFLLAGIGVLKVFERFTLARYKGMYRGLLLALTCIVMILLGQLTIKQIRIWQNSEILWRYVIDIYPNRVPLAHNNLGVAYGKKGMLDKAITEFKKSIAINSKFMKAHYNLGVIYKDKGMLDKAIFEYKKALIIKPDYAEAHTDLGNTYFKKGMLDEAISKHKKALTIKPDYAEAHTSLGLAYAKKGKLYDAIFEHKKALIIKPDYADAHTNLGNAYFKKGMLDEAVYEYEQAIAVKPNLTEAHNNLGVTYWRKGMLDEAIAQYKKALAISPNYVDAHHNLGNAYRKKDMLDEAIYEYRKAIAANPNYAKAHYDLGIAYYYKKNYKLAIMNCDRAAEFGYSVNPKLLELLKHYR